MGPPSQGDGSAGDRQRRALQDARRAQAERGRTRVDHSEVDLGAYRRGRRRSLQKANVAVGAVADSRMLSTDANLTARDFWVYKEHPEVGKMQHCGIPWKMSGTPTEVRSAAPTLGQHTDGVLTGLLGYSASDVEALHKLGALD